MKKDDLAPNWFAMSGASMFGFRKSFFLSKELEKGKGKWHSIKFGNSLGINDIQANNLVSHRNTKL